VPRQPAGEGTKEIVKPEGVASPTFRQSVSVVLALVRGGPHHAPLIIRWTITTSLGITSAVCVEPKTTPATGAGMMDRVWTKKTSPAIQLRPEGFQI
jgi:hypothetical protein